MIAANAQIGAVKAQLFPTVMITGFAGGGGTVVSGQTFGPFGLFTALPTITLPIFNAGRLVAQVDLAEARTREAVIRYQQAIQGAVSEVADSLVEVRKREEVRQEQVKLVAALQDASDLASNAVHGRGDQLPRGPRYGDPPLRVTNSPSSRHNSITPSP